MHLHLQISSLTIPNNSDDSLHTPHVIFPLSSDISKRKGAISPGEDLSIPILQPDTGIILFEIVLFSSLLSFS